ncbi:glycine-rich domain-containing protein [Paracoccus sp. SSK6]|uniref:glycine-rich domain-containing protein n=1 Tax=Paracoccus sp. SSK6 TaxID=3143131 RepID=UPI003219D30C
MSAAKFPFRLFKNGQEIVFPKGARRFIKCDTALVDGDGEVESTIYGGAVYTGSSAFRRHMVSLSCTDITVAPLVGLWKGDVVTLHSPTEMAVPGSNVELPYDAVPGSVYGVDAEDTEVGRVAGGGRSVSIPGADVIRFRPVMKCMVVERSFDSEFGRGQAGWGLTLRDVDGFDGGDAESDALTVRLSPQLFPASFDQGASFSLDLTELTSVSEGGLTVAYTLESGSALPPGVSRTGGVISGTLTTPGLHAFAVRATALNAYAVQTYAVHVAAAEASAAETWGRGTGGEILDYTDYDGVKWRSHTFLGANLFNSTLTGLFEALIVAGGGGGGSNNSNVPGGGGGGGGIVRKTLKVAAGSHPIEVGAGGSGAHGAGANGSNSSAFGLTALGGGAGSSLFANRDGFSGGCGGGAIGATKVDQNEIGYGGSGLASIPGSEWCGQSGSSGTINTNIADRRGGGGGGFSQRGQIISGGDGYLSDMLGTAAWYSGGGGGGCGTTYPVRPGGQGGGGFGGRGTSFPAPGAQNTGGGGGGRGPITSTANAGSGGSGIVIVRYKV